MKKIVLLIAFSLSICAAAVAQNSTASQHTNPALTDVIDVTYFGSGSPAGTYTANVVYTTTQL